MSNRMSNERKKQLFLIFAIGIGGMLGSIARFGISLLWTTNGDFPYATFIVNVIGCFFIGFFMNNRRLKHFLHPHVLTGIQTGFIGSFTTYSTFAMETIQLWHKHQQFLAISYVLMSVFGGALCYVLGCQVTTRKRRRSL